MTRDLILSLLLVSFAVVDLLCFLMRVYKNRKCKFSALFAITAIFIAESTYFIFFFCGLRLPNETFCLFSTMCILTNVVFVLLNANRTIRRASFILTAFSLVFTMYSMCFVTQEQLNLDGKVYIAEYENVTGISNTIVRCYEKRGSIFTTRDCELVLDYGIVLGAAPDLSNGQYTVVKAGG